MKLHSNKDILDICSKAYDEFIKYENVIGVGLGFKYINNQNTNELCIQVLVEKKIDESKLNSDNIIPKNFNGMQTDVVESGAMYCY